MLLLEKATYYNTYNIGNPYNEVSVKDIALKICDYLNMEPSLVYETFPFNDPMSRKPNIAKICGLGFTPKVDFEVGLKKVIDYKRGHI